MKRTSPILSSHARTGRKNFWMISLLVLFAFIAPQAMYGQASNYSFTESTETYTAVGGTTSTATGDDATQGGIPIGFSFTFSGVAYTHFAVTTNGFIKLGTSNTVAIVGITSAFQNTNFGLNTDAPLLAPLWDDNHVNAGSIKYNLTGTAPNQVLEVGWEGVNIGGSGGTSATNVASYKVRLIQTSNVIEFVYSSTIATAGTLSASIGIEAPVSSYLSLTPGTPATVSSVAINNAISSVTAIAGKKYTFTPPLPCVAPTSQPTALLLTPASATTINGSFTAASPVADRYLVVRTTGAAPTAPVNGTTYTAGTTALGGTIVYAGNLTTFSSTGLTGNTSYSYYVYSYSSVCSGGPAYNSTAPLSATAITCAAVPGSITTSAVTVNSFTLNWASSLGGNASPITYTIEVAADNAFASPVVGSPFTVTDPTVSQVISGLNGATIYYYHIKANGSCNSAYSTTASVSTSCIAPTTQPTALVLTPTSTSVGGSFTAASPAVSGYLVVRTTGAAPTAPVNGTTYTAGATALGGTIVYAGTATTFSNTGLTANTAYSYFVYSYASGCTGAPAYNTVTPLTGTTTTCPAVPGTITTSGVTINSFTLNWTASAGATTYTVEVATDNAFASPIAGSPFTVTSPTVTQVVSGLNGSTTYYYRIRANGATCNSSYSSVANIGTLCTIPTSLSASVTVVSNTPNTANGSFTAAPPIVPSGYLVVRTTTNTAPIPVNSTTYTVGTNAIGYIEYVGTAAGSWISTALTPGVTYYYWVFSYASGCNGAPAYSATATTSAISTAACSFPPGTYTVGAAGNFSSLTQVAGYLAACPLTGAYVFELSSDYNPASETYPIVFPNLAGSSATNTVTIRPATGSTASITSANSTGTLRLDGMDYLILDGRPGGTGTPKTLVVENTNVGGFAIQFLNDATNNLIEYATLRSVNTSTTSGTVVFGTTTGTVGNDNNTITACDIKDGATLPLNAIYASGSTGSTAVNNSNNIVSNSNIYNFFSAGSASNGITIGTGNTDWSITSNHFYQTATRTSTSPSTHTAINISTTAGNNFVVTGNYIGGSAINAGGTPWTMAGAFANRFIGISISAGSVTASSLQNNTISNFTWASTSGATTTSGVWAGIYVANGAVNVGTVTGNVIGSATGTGSITCTISTTGGVSVGIGSASISTVNISNNTISSISVLGSTATFSHSFNGIWNTGSATALVINNNKIGGATANSIYAGTASTSSTAQIINGILNSGGATAISITSNTIDNLNNAYVPSTVSSSVIVRGISSSNGVNTITDNIVRNLSTAANATGTTVSASVVGISQTSTTAGQTISQNTVYTLSNSNASAAVSVIGIHVNGPTTGTNLVARNLVHSLSTLSTSGTADIRGINISGGTATYQNNIVRLGIDALGNNLTNGTAQYGIYDVLGTNNFYHNTVYVGGVGVDGSAATYAFRSDVTTNTRSFLNNIFVNERSNGTGTGKHYAVRLAGTAVNPAGLTSNYNIYQATGTGGVFGFFNSADVANIAAWQTATGKDANSIYASPCFSGATLGTPNLHLTNCAGAGNPANGSGTLISSVLLDFDGETRSGLTPVDIGADAGNYGPLGVDILPSALVTPVIGGCKTNAEVVSAAITNNSTSIIDFSVNNVTVNVTATGGYSSSIILSTGTLAVGGTQNVTLPATIDMSVNGTYVFNINTSTVGDVNTVNDILLPVNRVTLSLGGTYTVGVGGNYTTLTAASTDFNNTTCITAPIIFSLTDATYSTGETFPITFNNNIYTSAVNTVTIKPANGISALVTGSSTAATLKLNGADYVTIDGSNNGSTTRNLTFENTNVDVNSVVVWIASTTTDGATNNTIKNVITKGNASNTTLGGIVSGSGTTTTTIADVPHTNLVIQNNSVTKSYYGIAIQGGATAQTGTVITQNSLGSATASDYLGNTGLFVQNTNGAQITNNTVFNIISSAAGNPTGMMISTGNINTNINANNIQTLAYTGTGGYGSKGMIVIPGSTTSNVTISNNMISDLRGDGWSSLASDAIVGIRIGAHAGTNYTSGGIKIYNNSVNLGSGTFAGSSSGTLSAALYISSSSSALDIRNNIFRTNLQNSGASTAKTYAIYSDAANTAFTSINNNDYVIGGTQGSLGYIGSARNTLADIQTGFGQNTNSLNVAPVFVSATDLHLPLGSNFGLLDKGVAIAAITTDFDGQPRSNTPDVGADEFGDRPATPTSLVQSPVTPSCTGGSFLRVLPTAPAGVTYYLQANATDTSTANPFVGDSINVATNGTYYVNAKNTATSTWSTGSASVVVNNIPLAPLPPSPVADMSPACLTTNITVPAPGAPTVTYYWQGTNATGTSNALNASSSYAVTASGTYYVAAFDASTNCWSNTNGVAVLIDTQIPIAPTVIPSAPVICAGSTQLLAAPSNLLSTPSGTGTSFSTAVSTSNTLGPNPLQNYWGGAKQQQLFRASELTAMGLVAGSSINSLQIQMNTASTTYALLSLSVKMKGTNIAALSPTAFETGLTVVRPAATYTPVASWSTIVFNTPFVWNGTDNIVLEINYSNNNAPTTGDNSAFYTTTSYVSTLFYRVDNTTSTDMNNFAGTPSYSYSQRNNFKFNVANSTNLTWTPTTALYTNSGATTPYVLNAFEDSIYAKPSATTTYSVVSHVGTCTSTPTNVTVTVNPLPIVDAGPTQSVCPGSDITLTATGATSYTWNNGVTNGVAFPAPNVTTLYTVTGTDANTCSATDTVTIFALPTTPITISPAGPIVTCQNQPVVLTANGPAPGPVATISQWNFNAGNLTPNVGTGVASLTGGTSGIFTSGAGSSDAVQPGQAWQTSTYPSGGANPKTAGVQFNVSTVGYQGVTLSYDLQLDASAANKYVVQYNPDVTNAFAPWTNVQTLTYSTSGSFVPVSINLSSIPAASNNANFGIRILSDTSTGGVYVGATGPYSTAGAVHYDMVTFAGNPITTAYSWSPVPSTSPTFTPITSGTYTVTATQSGVCPGTASVNVTINPTYTTNASPSICANQTYNVFGVGPVNTPGIYIENRTSVKGCDSIVAINLTVYPVYNNTIPPVTICSNQSYTLAGGNVVTTAGTYTRTVPSIHGCDSTVTVQINVQPAQLINITASTCAGTPYTLPNGTTVTAAGSYTNTFPSVNGCDSTIVTALTVKPVFTSTQNVAICSGATHTQPNGTTQGTAGTYVFPFTAINGCDSTITVVLTVNPVYTTNVAVDLCPGETYTLANNTVISTGGTHLVVVNSISGCDSTIIVNSTMRPVYNLNVAASICQGGSYTLANGATVTTAGVYSSGTQSIYGCDSLVTVTLSINPSYNQAVSGTICQGSSYVLPNGTSVTAAGVYTSNLVSSKGCDSTIVTTLTVSPSPNLNLGNDIAVLNPPVTLNAGLGFASYLWNTGATTQTLQVSQNGTYSVTVTNQQGCSATDEIQVNFLSSVVNLGENGGSISLFPNPTTDRFTLNVYGYTGGGNMRLDLINAIGQVVKTEMVNNAMESFNRDMDVSTLPSGTYTLRVKGVNAEANLRVIIAK